jgi:hypothetical protein
MAGNIPTSSIERPYKISPNWEFCLEIYHLATLVLKRKLKYNFNRILPSMYYAQYEF